MVMLWEGGHDGQPRLSVRGALYHLCPVDAALGNWSPHETLKRGTEALRREPLHNADKFGVRRRADLILMCYRRRAQGCENSATW
jgi:hypothetical protein